MSVIYYDEQTICLISTVSYKLRVSKHDYPVLKILRRIIICEVCICFVCFPPEGPHLSGFLSASMSMASAFNMLAANAS